MAEKRNTSGSGMPGNCDFTKTYAQQPFRAIQGMRHSVKNGYIDIWKVRRGKDV
jgi:hypothetical protein